MSALPKKDGGSVMKKIANKKAFQDLLLIIIGSGLTALPVKCIYDPLDMVTGRIFWSGNHYQSVDILV